MTVSSRTEKRLYDPAPAARHRKRQERLSAIHEAIVFVSTGGTLFALGMLVGGQVLAR